MACSQAEEPPSKAIGITSSALVADKLSPLFSLPPGAKPVRLVVKFNEGSDVRVRGGRLSAAASSAASAADLASIDRELSARGLALSRLLGRVSDAELSDLRQRGEARSARALPDLGLYHQIPASAFRSEGELEELRLYFARMQSVEVAYIESEPPPPPDANTPDFRSRQTYKDPAPYGMDVQAAAAQPGGRGTGVRVVDVESGLRPGHEDLPAAFYTRGELSLEAPRLEHTAAVAGIIVGRDNVFGVTGIVPDAQFGSSSTFPFTSTSTAEAMTAPLASGALRAGDVLLMELQVSGPVNLACACEQTTCDRYLPGEFQPAIYDAVRTLVANGVIVVEAGGNGYVSLDDPALQGMFDRTVRDSGAIVVGARAAHTGGAYCFSNTGRRIDVNAWGGDVVSTGYGTLYSGTLAPNDYYANGFGGTSSASALVTGAVAALQGVVRAFSGAPLTPVAMRDLLRSTGTPQTVDLSRPIGAQPDLRRAIGVIRGQPQPVETTFTENFESGFTFFTNVSGSQLAWTRLRGATPSTGTGPSADHTSGSGYYAYTEATGSSGSPNRTALLQSPCLDLRGQTAARFTFFYHMVGSQMGRLSVEADRGCDGGALDTLFSQQGARSGTELNGYLRQDLDLSQFVGATVRLLIRGVTGSGGLSDMAVDDLSVTLTSTPCSSDAQCSPGVCENQACVDCRGNSECPGGVCLANSCVECSTHAQCPEDSDFCTQALCTSANLCATQPTTCAVGLFCSSQLSRCVECLNDSHCGSGRTCNVAQGTCSAASCQSFAATTQQHVNAGRATTVRVSTRVEARVVGSNELLDSRSLLGSFSTTSRTLRTRPAGGFQIGTCP